jgi:hypothetical protein
VFRSHMHRRVALTLLGPLLVRRRRAVGGDLHELGHLVERGVRASCSSGSVDARQARVRPRVLDVERDARRLTQHVAVHEYAPHVVVRA